MDSHTNNALYNQEYARVISELSGDEAGRRAAWNYMLGSTAVYAGEVVYTSYMPKLFDAATYARMKYIAETTYSILEKVTQAYLDDVDFRRLFAFDPRLEELICLPRDYTSIIPFARVDMFLNEETLEATFCEFNTDGSSGMNENREAEASVRLGESFKRFANAHSVRGCNDELFCGWVDEFMNIYATYAFAKERPHVAIVDFLDLAVIEEFKVYAHLFAERGIDCSIYDMRELEFDGAHLVGHHAYLGRDSAVIDAVWRRCVASDVLARWSESQALVEAARHRAAAIIGSFTGHVAHDKRLFRILRMPEARALLSDEENRLVEETIPHTLLLDSSCADLDAIKASPAEWVIKPTDEYGSHKVFTGPDFERDEWARIVDAHANGAAGKPFLAQRFCTPFKTEAIPFYNREEDFTAPPRMYNNLSGLFLINGRFSGVFSRLGPGSVILGRLGGVTAPTMWVDCDDVLEGGAR